MFSDPSAADGDSDAPEGSGVVPCPSDDAAPGVILEGSDTPPNEIELVAFPYADIEAARACDFADADLDQLPILVVTANPGEVHGVDRWRGAGIWDRVDRAEREGVGPHGWSGRWAPAPPPSFVAHCVLPRPAPPPRAR